MNLLTNGRVAIDQNQFLPIYTALPAPHAITNLAKQFFRSHLDIHFSRSVDQLLQAQMIFVL